MTAARTTATTGSFFFFVASAAAATATTTMHQATEQHYYYTNELMNNGGVPYEISNNHNNLYKANFGMGDEGEGIEYFDVYGEVRTLYSQTYWTRNEKIPLPPAIVERFRNKVMAITGYEIDQVVHAATANDHESEKKKTHSIAEGAALGGFSCYPRCDDNNEDRSIPIYHAYNHHYFSWLIGSNAEIYDLQEEQNTTTAIKDRVQMPNPTFTGIKEKNEKKKYPSSIVFQENPGGEYRKSYHGYPNGYAQLIESPEYWVVEPMQIDTHNRDSTPDVTDDSRTPEFWFLPQQLTNNAEKTEASANPLLECPCTDRIAKITNETGSYLSYTAIINGEQTVTTVPYRVDCKDEPRSNMLRRGHGDYSGYRGKNAACSADTYNGGLHCCRHTYLLTDLNQDSLIPRDQVDVYYLKWRYYFQEYKEKKNNNNEGEAEVIEETTTQKPNKKQEKQKPQQINNNNNVRKASHEHLYHWVFLVDSNVNDYEEDNDHYGSASIGRLSANITAREMGFQGMPDDFDVASENSTTRITPIVMTPHCHAPSCIRMELYKIDDDGGDKTLLCNATVRYGTGARVFDEANYAAIPPCLFGYKNQREGEGGLLPEPFVLTPSTKLMAIKYFNNTYRHLGQMAQWTGLTTYTNSENTGTTNIKNMNDKKNDDIVTTVH